MLGWPFHILLDFPFHSTEYFPTQIFWPVSDFVFNGTNWANFYIWLPDLAGLLVLFLWRRHQKLS